MNAENFNINDITRSNLLSEDFYIEILEDADELRKESIRRKLKDISVIHGVSKGNVDKMVSAAWKMIKEDRRDGTAADVNRAINGIYLEWGEKGVLQTVDNFYKVLSEDPVFSNLKYNELSNAPESFRDGKIQPWEDADDAEARRYIEKVYGLSNIKKYEDAIRIRMRDVKYHPVRDIIDSIKWDGQNRIETILIKWLKCEDTPYTREVSRLIFAGGINRIYNPGCKFDDVPVLIGLKQGEGKSTFVRWLAMEDKFFREVGEIDGQKGIEILDGAWICEMSELLALTKTKEVEAVKSYMTKTKDSVRRPYDRRLSERPRQCVFIGTTNKRQFLTDKTGNRRFYPVVVNSSGYDLFDNEDAIRHDIAQCWAEAKQRFDEGNLPAFADPTLRKPIQEAQADAAEDDWRDDLIRDYLDMRDKVCIREIWFEALGTPENISPSRKDSNDIAVIIQGTGEWVRGKAERTERYGVQMVYHRIMHDISEFE